MLQLETKSNEVFLGHSDNGVANRSKMSLILVRSATAMYTFFWIIYMAFALIHFKVRTPTLAVIHHCPSKVSIESQGQFDLLIWQNGYGSINGYMAMVAPMNVPKFLWGRGHEYEAIVIHCI